MGNHVSCLFLTRPCPKTVKLVGYSKGGSKQVKLPATAGKIMLDEPGHAVSLVRELQRTGRVVAMRADDKLVVGEVYLLVPLGRVNSRVMEREKMVLVEEMVNRRSKSKRRGGARVLPEVGGVGYQLGEEGKNGMAKGMEGEDTGMGSFRKGNHRPWLPVLYTISEEL